MMMILMIMRFITIQIHNKQFYISWTSQDILDKDIWMDEIGRRINKDLDTQDIERH